MKTIIRRREASTRHDNVFDNEAELPRKINFAPRSVAAEPAHPRYGFDKAAKIALLLMCISRRKRAHGCEGVGGGDKREREREISEEICESSTARLKHLPARGYLSSRGSHVPRIRLSLLCTWWRLCARSRARVYVRVCVARVECGVPTLWKARFPCWCINHKARR